VTAGVIPPQVNGQTETPSEKLVTALRLLNTQEVVYHSLTGRFVRPEETKGILSRSPIDLENPQPYELAIRAAVGAVVSFQSETTVGDSFVLRGPLLSAILRQLSQENQ